MRKPSKRVLLLIRVSALLVFFSASYISVRFANNARHLLRQSQDEAFTKLPNNGYSTLSDLQNEPLTTSLQLFEIVKKKESFNYWVLNHLKWHDSQLESNQSGRILVWGARPNAGIGDQVQAILAAYQYAVLSRRVLRIDWRFPLPVSLVMSRRARERFLYDGDSASIRESLQRAPKWRYQFRGTGLSTEMFSYLNSNADVVVLRIGPSVQTGNDAVLNLQPNNVKIPPWTPEVARAALRKILEPSVELSTIVERRQRELRLCPAVGECQHGNERYVTVHARLGIGTKETSLVRFAGMEKNLQSIALCFARAVHTFTQIPPSVVFVASDTVTWPRLFEKELNKLMPEVRVEYLQEELMHIHSISRTKGRKVFLSQHVEQLLIGDGEQTIALRSGFPEVGFWRGTGKIYTMLKKYPCMNGRPILRLNGTWTKL